MGDVVAVSFSLKLLDVDPEIEGVHPHLGGFVLVGCYDQDSLELLDAVRYSDHFNEFAFLSQFYPQGGDAQRPEEFAGGSLYLAGNIRTLEGAAERFLPAGQEFPLLTVYFRITGGDPGTETEVYPCENTYAGRGCESTQLSYSVNSPSRWFEALSSLHIPGTIRILPGPPTRPDPPPLPPDARIYDEAPTPESAALHFELDGPAVVVPGSTAEMDLFVTSNHEFSGFMSALRFPAEHLALRDVVEHTRPGIVRVDNTGGGFGILLSNSRRRIGQEGERVRLATLRFEVLEAARHAGEVEIRFDPYDNFFNWVVIHHRQGMADPGLPTTSEVSPLLVTEALLKLQVEPTVLGDVNLDYAVNLTDPIRILDHLFGGGKLVCGDAADFNDDAAVDMSDPIAILNALFVGGPTPPERAVLCTGS